MDRDSPKDSGVLASQPNGRKTLRQPFGNRRLSSKSSGRLDSKETSPGFDTERSSRPVLLKLTTLASHKPEGFISNSSPRSHRSNSSSSSSLFDTPTRNTDLSRNTRIPRPKSTAPVIESRQSTPTRQYQPRRASIDMREPISLKEAFRLAERQEASGSITGPGNMKDAFNMALAEENRSVDGSPSPAPRPYTSNRTIANTLPPRLRTSRSENDELGRQLAQFDKNHQLRGGNAPINGLFAHTHRVGPNISETGRALAKKASNSSLSGSPERRKINGQTDVSPKRESPLTARKKENNPPNTLLPSHDIAIPTIEYESASDERASPIVKPGHPSPEKSYNWQLDADFTAGDLQISQSPRVGPARNAEAVSHASSGSVDSNSNTPTFRRSNTRLDRIREREAEVAKATIPEDDSSLSKRGPTSLDQVREREMEALSRRAVASSRLDEIRIKNSEARSESPEMRKSSSKGDTHSQDLPLNIPEKKNVTEGEIGLHKPSTTLGDTEETFRDVTPKEADDGSWPQEGNIRQMLPKRDSHDLLLRLARATSSSPPKDTSEGPIGSDPPLLRPSFESRESSRSRLTHGEEKPRNLEIKNSRGRPTVGFVGVRRVSSSDSIPEKRTSRPVSDADPTDRIEAEMKLFALMDNYSEKGSIRAPSPASSEPIEEETPGPCRIDPLSQPTPRVIGAYVETPATMKVDKGNGLIKGLLDAPEIIATTSGPDPSEPPSTQETRQKGMDSTKISDPSSQRSSSVPVINRRRRRSSSRRRPPLINTANPPSVKDDIRAILQRNQIDDSTLDDFDSVLANHKIDDEELKQIVNETVLKLKVEDGLDLPGVTDRERELLAYDRMSKQLETGLLGIRSAKKGIERLEDKVTHTEQKDSQTHADLNASSPTSTAQPPTTTDDFVSTTIRFPALYRRNPNFRLTTFGLLAFLATLWLGLEIVFYGLYGAPKYHCTPDIPCQWSPNEPYFPYTMPFMLDEWSTGGKGRAMVWRIGEEVGDIAAEVTDWITNTDFTQFDQRYMNVWERKRHRRRLRKHGLIPKWIEPQGYKPKFPAWHAAKVAREHAQEMGYDVEDETMSADEQVSH